MNSSTSNQSIDILVGALAMEIVKLHNAGKAEEAQQRRYQAEHNYGQKFAKELDDLIINFATFGLPK